MAEPSSIERGQSSTLRWTVTDATSISIDNGIGTVQATGSRRVFPSDSTTYTLTATGPGGTKTATATVNVTEPPPPPPPPAAPKPTLEQMLSGSVVDAYFDYDKSDIREDARAALTKDADALKAIFASFPDASDHHRRPLRRARIGRIQPGAGRPPRHRRQGLPDATGRSRRQAEDHQLRQGTSAVHRPRRVVLAEEPPRALLHRAVKSDKGRAVPAHPQPAGRSTRPAHEEIL